MPSTSEKQRRFMGAELARKRAGKKTKTGMSEGQLKDFAKKLPKKRKRGSGELTALGQRVMQGYETKFGDQGHAKFEAAVREGRVDRAKMFKRSTSGSFASRTS